MQRPTISAALAALLGLCGTGAHASLFCPAMGYQGGTFGAGAFAEPCLSQAAPNAMGLTSAIASASSSSASANLLTGELTVYTSSSQSPYPSSVFWDTLVFSGLPASGGNVTETLFLTGGIASPATAGVSLYLGAPTTPAGWSQARTGFALAANNFPASVSVQALLQNGVPVLFVASMQGSAPVGGLVDLYDPPFLHFDLPAGVSFTSASGVFTNAIPVPEASSAVLLACGLAALAGVARRRRS
jgi:hypothetical protein